MIRLISLLLPLVFADAAAPPVTFPLFLRQDFSTVLEFDEPATKVVLGDGRNFRVERLGTSIVIKTLVTNASTNMFVYFNAKPPKVFMIKASDDGEPTYYHSFKSISAPLPIPPFKMSRKTGVALVSAAFDSKKDYLTVQVRITAGSSEKILPRWRDIRLAHKHSSIAPQKVWSSRKEIQKDAVVTARFIFYRPDIPRDFKDVTLAIPVEQMPAPLTVALRGKR